MSGFGNMPVPLQVIGASLVKWRRAQFIIEKRNSYDDLLWDQLNVWWNTSGSYSCSFCHFSSQINDLRHERCGYGDYGTCFCPLRTEAALDEETECAPEWESLYSAFEMGFTKERLAEVIILVGLMVERIQKVQSINFPVIEEEDWEGEHEPVRSSC